jgi:uncharacterized membrane protein YvbJ
MNRTLVGAIALVLLIGVAFFAGRCSSDDSRLTRQLEASEAVRQDLQNRIDSLLVDSDNTNVIDSLERRIDDLSGRLASARHESDAALAALERLPTYETLSDDDLAHVADSLYAAILERSARPGH